MKKRHLLTISLLCCFVYSYAQDEHTSMIPDYHVIKTLSKDKSSAFYYPKLYARWAANDTTLTAREMQMLYFGKFYNAPRGLSDFNKKHYVDSLQAVYAKGRANIDDNDMKKMLRYYLEEHKSDPFRLKTINAIYNIYKGQKDPRAAFYSAKLLKVCYTIMATGDGRSYETALHVNCVSDEYTMISLLHLEVGDRQSLKDNKYDYLTVKENRAQLPGVYFNVEQIFEEYSLLLGTDDFKNVINRNRE